MTPTPAELQPHLQRARERGLIGVVKEAGAAWGVDPAILLGIASRESRVGAALAPDCTGDGGRAHGVFQIDERFHPGFASRTDRCDDRAGAIKAASLLAANKEDLPTTRAAVAAYNAGPQSVEEALQRGASPDLPTTGGDYSSDVLQRAEVFRPSIGGASKAGGVGLLLISGASLFALSQIGSQ
jgi:hypothetical protein